MPKYNLLNQFLPEYYNTSDLELETALRGEINRVRNLSSKLGPQASGLLENMIAQLSGGNKPYSGEEIYGGNNLRSALKQMKPIMKIKNQLSGIMSNDFNTWEYVKKLEPAEVDILGLFFNNVDNVHNSLLGSVDIDNQMENLHSGPKTPLRKMLSRAGGTSDVRLDVALKNGAPTYRAYMGQDALTLTPSLFGYKSNKEESFNIIAHEFGHSIYNSAPFNNDPQLRELFDNIRAEAGSKIPNIVRSKSFQNYALEDTELFSRIIAHGAEGRSSPYAKGDRFYNLLTTKGIIPKEFVSMATNMSNSVKYSGGNSANIDIADSSWGAPFGKNKFYATGYASGGRVRGNKVIKVGENGDEYVISNSMLTRLEGLIGGPVTDESLLTAIQAGQVTMGKSQIRQTGHFDEPPGVRNVTRTRVVVPKPPVPPAATAPAEAPVDSFDTDLKNIQEEFDKQDQIVNDKLKAQAAGGGGSGRGGGRKPPTEATPDSPEDADYKRKKKEIDDNNAKARKLEVDDKLKRSKERLSEAQAKAAAEEAKKQPATPDEGVTPTTPPPGTNNPGGRGVPQQPSGGDSKSWGMTSAQRSSTKANNPELFTAAEQFGKVTDLTDSKIQATTKVTTDLNDNLTRLVVTMRDASGAVKQYTVAQDLTTGKIGPEDVIAASSKQNKAIADNATYATRKQAEFEQLGYPSVYKELAKRDPAYMEKGAITDLQVKQRNNVKIFDVERQDQAGNPVQTRILTDLQGNILPETTRRTADFTKAIAQNSLEFLKWTAAVSIVYTPLLKLQELVKVSIENQSQLANVMVTMNAAQEDTNKIFGSAASVANATGESITGVLEGYNQAYRATGDIQSVTERYAKANVILKDSITLAKLAEIDQASATDILVASLRQTNTPIDEGVTLLDKWVAVSKVANVDVNTLATSFAIVAEAADNAGLSIDELNGLIATVAASGITSAKETGNAVRAIITGVTNNDAVKQLEKFGIAVQNSQGQARTFKEIMTDIRSGIAGGAISPDQLNSLARAIGGGNRRQAQVVTAIVGQKTASTAEQASAIANGEAEKALAIEMATVETATIILGNAFQSLAQTLGTEGGLLAVVTDLTNNSTKAVNGLNNVAKLLGTALPILAITGVAKGLGLPSKLGAATTGAISGLESTLNKDIYRQDAEALIQKERMTQGYSTRNVELTSRQLALQGANQFAPNAKAAGNFVSSWAPGAMTAGLFAYSNAVQGHPGQAAIAGGASIAAEFAGKALGAAPGIGAAIGGSIAEIFIQAWNRAIADARNTLYKPQPATPEKAPKIPTYEDEVAKLTKEEKLGLFGQTGGTPIAPEEVSKQAKFGKFNQEMQMGVPGILSQVGITKAPDPWQTSINEAMLKSPEYMDIVGIPTSSGAGMKPVTDAQKKAVENLRARITAQFDKFMAPEIVTQGEGEYGSFNTRKNAIVATGTTDITNIQAQSREDLKKRMQPFAENPMTVKQYTTAMGEIEGYQNKLPTLVAAGQISGNVTDTTKALKDFADLLAGGATEAITEIVTLAGDIGDLSTAIDAAKQSGVVTPDTTIKVNGEDVKFSDAQAQLASKKETYNMAVSNEAGNIQLRKPIRDIVSMIDLTSTQFQMVKDAAVEMYNKDLSELTVQEKASSEARDANIKYLVKTKDDYTEVTKLQSSYLNDAMQKLQEEGKLKLQPAGFSQDKELTMAQYRQAQQMYPARLASVQATAAAAGGTYKEEKSQQVIMAKDGMMWLDTDMRIFQSLLAEISENTKKMVDGMYNLPEGASFWVPYSAVSSYYNKNTNTTAGPGGSTTTPEQAAKLTPNEATALGVNSPRTPANITLDENVMARQAMQAARMAELAKSTVPPTTKPIASAGYPMFMTAGGPDFGPRTLPGQNYKGISGFMDAGAGTPKYARDSTASTKLPEVSTNLNLNVTASFQVNLNAAVLARELKTIMTNDLIKYGNNATSVTRTVQV